MRLVARVGAIAIAAAAVTSTAMAAPAGPSITERHEAKSLADEGLALYGKGDYAGAVDRFARAEAIVALPTIRLQRARALERLGRWVEAKRTYGEVARTELPKGAPPVHRKAIADAAKELEALEPRVPRLSIVLLPAMRADDTISIDGRLMSDPQEPFFELDPGEHVVEVSRSDGARAHQSVSLSPSERRTLELPVTAPPAPKPAPAPPEPSMPLPELLGWIGVGVGGAALVVSAATGVPAIGLASDLDARCPNGKCPASAFDDLSEYDALRWTAGVTLIAGVVLAGAGSTAIVLSRQSDASGAPRVEGLLGPTSLAAKVTF